RSGAGRPGSGAAPRPDRHWGLADGGLTYAELFVGDLMALDVDVGQQTVEPSGEPPVAVAEEFHGGRDQDHPDDGGVNEDRGGQSDPEHLAEDVDAEHEGEEH